MKFDTGINICTDVQTDKIIAQLRAELEPVVEDIVRKALRQYGQ